MISKNTQPRKNLKPIRCTVSKTMYQALLNLKEQRGLDQFAIYDHALDELFSLEEKSVLKRTDFYAAYAGGGVPLCVTLNPDRHDQVTKLAQKYHIKLNIVIYTSLFRFC